MTDEPIRWDEEYLDHLEELLDVLSDGFGINAPSDEDAQLYQEMLEDLREARP